jgi:hypothetical protein
MVQQAGWNDIVPCVEGTILCEGLGILKPTRISRRANAFFANGKFITHRLEQAQEWIGGPTRRSPRFTCHAFREVTVH